MIHSVSSLLLFINVVIIIVVVWSEPPQDYHPSTVEERPVRSPSEKSYVRDLDEGSNDELVFRGLILRHQLVALLKNKIFFNEGDGVR